MHWKENTITMIDQDFELIVNCKKIYSGMAALDDKHVY